MSFTRRAEWESGEGRGRCDGEGQREEEGERERQHGNERKRKRQKRIEPHRSVTFHNSTALLSSHHDDFAFTRQKSRSTVEFIVTGTEGRRFV